MSAEQKEGVVGETTLKEGYRAQLSQNMAMEKLLQLWLLAKGALVSLFVLHVHIFKENFEGKNLNTFYPEVRCLTTVGLFSCLSFGCREGLIGGGFESDKSTG